MHNDQTNDTFNHADCSQAALGMARPVHRREDGGSSIICNDQANMHAINPADCSQTTLGTAGHISDADLYQYPLMDHARYNNIHYLKMSFL